MEGEGSGMCWEQISHTNPSPLEEAPRGRGADPRARMGPGPAAKGDFWDQMEIPTGASREIQELHSTHRNSFQEKSSNDWSWTERAEVAPGREGQQEWEGIQSPFPGQLTQCLPRTSTELSSPRLGDDALIIFPLQENNFLNRLGETQIKEGSKLDL